MPKLISASPQQVLYVTTWKLAHTWGCNAFVILSKCLSFFLRLEEKVFTQVKRFTIKNVAQQV